MYGLRAFASCAPEAVPNPPRTAHRNPNKHARRRFVPARQGRTPDPRGHPATRTAAARQGARGSQ
eukprot:15454179-Alexandrium_andersonii.AAC.1